MNCETEACETDVSQAINRLSQRIEDSVVKATELAISKSVPKTQVTTVPAQAEKPVFKNLGEFANAVVRATAARDSGAMEKLAISAKATGASEGVNADGGYLVPTIFSQN